MAEKCEVIGCSSPGIGCHMGNPETPSHFFCVDHAADHGFCALCGVKITKSLEPGMCNPCYDFWAVELKWERRVVDSQAKES